MEFAPGPLAPRAALFVAVIDFVSGNPGDAELAAQRGHALPILQPQNESHALFTTVPNSVRTTLVASEQAGSSPLWDCDGPLYIAVFPTALIQLVGTALSGIAGRLFEKPLHRVSQQLFEPLVRSLAWNQRARGQENGGANRKHQRKDTSVETGKWSEARTFLWIRPFRPFNPPDKKIQSIDRP